MNITSIKVQVSKKINLGNYETKNYLVETEITPEEDRPFTQSINEMKVQLEHIINEWERLERIEHSKNNITIVEQPTTVKTKTPTKQQPFSKNKATYICPECGEQMHKKEGKEYYLCSKHWGYPAMIEKGQVRDKTYNRGKATQPTK